MSDEELDRIANPVTGGVSSVEMLRAVPRLVAALRADREELARLRSIFANDMLDESVVARGAYEQGRKDFEREAVEALAPLAEMLDGDAARIDWHAVRARMKSPVQTLHELLGRMSLTRKQCDEPLTPPQLRPAWLGGVPWAVGFAPAESLLDGEAVTVGFAPAESLLDGEAVTVGPDGLWRRAAPGEAVHGHVRYHGGTAYVHRTQT